MFRQCSLLSKPKRKRHENDEITAEIARGFRIFTFIRLITMNITDIPTVNAIIYAPIQYQIIMYIIYYLQHPRFVYLNDKTSRLTRLYKYIVVYINYFIKKTLSIYCDARSFTGGREYFTRIASIIFLNNISVRTK